MENECIQIVSCENAGDTTVWKYPHSLMVYKFNNRWYNSGKYRWLQTNSASSCYVVEFMLKPLLNSWDLENPTAALRAEYHHLKKKFLVCIFSASSNTFTLNCFKEIKTILLGKIYSSNMKKIIIIVTNPQQLLKLKHVARFPLGFLDVQHKFKPQSS